jgi:hypothetical protein
MADDEGDDDLEQIAEIGNEVMDVLSAENVVVKLRGGDKITGSLVGFSRRSPPKKRARNLLALPASAFKRNKAFFRSTARL